MRVNLTIKTKDEIFKLMIDIKETDTIEVDTTTWAVLVLSISEQLDKEGNK